MDWQDMKQTVLIVMVIVWWSFVDDCICSEGNSGHEANSNKSCIVFGTAFIDTCGVCSEGNTDHPYNSDQDCNGDCFGFAFLDDCGICSCSNQSK